MIEFSGELSEQCKLLIAKEKSKKTGLLFAICTLVISVIVLLFGIINNKLIYCSFIIVLFVIMTIIAFIIPKNHIIHTKINSKITINTNSISMLYSTNYYTNAHPIIKQISDINKIIDFGICYCIIFKFGDITNAWVCEKRLISKGYICNFEEKFKNIIIIKTKNGNA